MLEPTYFSLYRSPAQEKTRDVFFIMIVLDWWWNNGTCMMLWCDIGIISDFCFISKNDLVHAYKGLSLFFFVFVFVIEWYPTSSLIWNRATPMRTSTTSERFITGRAAGSYSAKRSRSSLNSSLSPDTPGNKQAKISIKPVKYLSLCWVGTVAVSCSSKVFRLSIFPSRLHWRWSLRWGKSEITNIIYSFFIFPF